MPPNLDPSTDLLQAADGLETVTLLRRGSSASTAGTPIPHALRRAVTTREAAASDGRYTLSDVTWHLPAAELPTPPRLGDIVCDASGRRWAVLDAARTTLGSRWRCTARNLAVVYGLDDTINVLQAAYSKGVGGAMQPNWLPWKTGIRARIQPVATDIDSEYQARASTTRCLIFVEESLTLDHRHRIQGPDGTVYKVVGVNEAERIGELQSIEAEVTPWP